MRLEHTIPLKVNTGGVIPVIFASSILAFPATIATMFQSGTWGRTVADQLAYGMPLYNLLYIVGIVFSAYFYTDDRRHWRVSGGARGRGRPHRGRTAQP